MPEVFLISFSDRLRSKEELRARVWRTAYSRGRWETTPRRRKRLLTIVPPSVLSTRMGALSVKNRARSPVEGAPARSGLALFLPKQIAVIWFDNLASQLYTSEATPAIRRGDPSW